MKHRLLAVVFATAVLLMIPTSASAGTGNGTGPYHGQYVSGYASRVGFTPAEAFKFPNSGWSNAGDYNQRIKTVECAHA